MPPNFVSWVRDLGFEAVSVGVEMRQPAGRASQPLTAEHLSRLRASLPDLISDQFDALAAAAPGCQVILGANAHQYAARSIAELHGVPYFTALYAPVAIPSRDHPPPPAAGEGWLPTDAQRHEQRWLESRAAWNARALERVNHNRARRGLALIDDVLAHNLTERPWLAADPLLAPVPTTDGLEVFETGAWVLEDRTPLTRELAAFLDAGEPPIYVGFGSMPARQDAASMWLEASRAIGRRAIISRGWAELAAGEAHDRILVDEVNHQALFPRLAAIVHHGGAGTIAAAARAGLPQVVCPMYSDQFYWGSRVQTLGLGVAVVGGPGGQAPLQQALDPAVGERARKLAQLLRPDGTLLAAHRLVRA